jgi:ABC-type glycerol-3-phosphate transport system substrate-binding protein
LKTSFKEKAITAAVVVGIFVAIIGFIAAASAINQSERRARDAQRQETNFQREAPASEESHGLGGMEINIATWWPTDEDDIFECEEYNFTIRYMQYESYHDFRDNLQGELLSENRDFQIWAIEPTWFARYHAQELFAPIPLHHFQDEFGIAWNQSLISNTMRDGVPHGFSFGTEPTGGVYFNMRLLEEAGLARDLPFTLQAENNWTWETFTDIAREVFEAHFSVHDSDITSLFGWGIVSSRPKFLEYALASNGAAYATVDPVTGNFINATTTEEFRETIEWVVSLREDRLALHEDDIGGFVIELTIFNDGMAVFYVSENDEDELISLADDWGFVSFPRAPRMENHYSWVTQNIYVIPHFYSAEEIDNIMFAMQQWLGSLEADNDWTQAALAHHRDTRSVTETMVGFTRNPELQSFPAHSLMPGLGHTHNDNFAWRVWIGHDAQTIIDDAQSAWEAFLERINNL